MTTYLLADSCLIAWCDLNVVQVFMLTLRHALVRQHYGRALKIMMKQSEDKPAKHRDDKAKLDATNEDKDLDTRMVEVCISVVDSSLSSLHFSSCLILIMEIV